MSLEKAALKAALKAMAAGAAAAGPDASAAAMADAIEAFVKSAKVSGKITITPDVPTEGVWMTAMGPVTATMPVSLDLSDGSLS